MIPQSKDIIKNQDICQVLMSADGTAGCKASVQCGTDNRDYNDWNVCFKGGRQ